MVIRKTKRVKSKSIQACADVEKPGYVTGGHVTVSVPVQILEVRPKAIKVTQPDLINSWHGAAWLPRSLIKPASGLEGHYTIRDRPITLWMQKWLAIDKGLHYLLPGEEGELDMRLNMIEDEMKRQGFKVDTSKIDAETIEKIKGSLPGPIMIDTETHAEPPLPYVVPDEPEELERRMAIRDMERDQPSACEKLPTRPKPDQSVTILDTDLLCGEE